MRKRSNGKTPEMWKIFLVGLIGIKGLIFVFFIVPWQGPDEPTHFEYVAIFARQNNFNLKLKEDEVVQWEVLNSMKQNNFWELVEQPAPPETAKKFEQTALSILTSTQLDTKPPLYYFLCSLPLKILGVRSVSKQLLVGRAMSFLFSMGTLFFVFNIARLIFPENGYFPYAVLSFAAFLPQYSYISGVVNPDNLAIMLVTATTYMILTLNYSGVSSLRLLGIALLVALGLMTKRTTFITAPFFIISLFIVNPNIIFIQRIRNFLIGVGFLGGGVIMLNSLVGYMDPDTVLRMIDRVMTEIYQWEEKIGRLANADINSLCRFWAILFVSFWFSYGWMVFKMGLGWYLLLALMTLLSLTGLMTLAARLAFQGIWPRGLNARGVLIMGILILISLTSALVTHFDPVITKTQGRYLFPAISAIAVLFVLGLWGGCPGKYQETLLKGSIFLMIILNGVAVIDYLIPIFYL